MLNLKSARAAGRVLPVVALLAGCGGYSQVRDGATEQPVWPEMGAARPIVPATMRPDLDKLRKVQAGMTKTEVYALIGHPQYREGLVGVNEWNFVFQLPDGSGGTTTCQYKVLFDNAALARNFYWHPVACADRLNPAPPVAAAPAAPAQTRTLDLSTDMLFEFDSDRLRSEGIRMLDERVVSALTDAQRLQGIRLIGYADRLGADDYNMTLSQRRADAVKAHLVAKGVPAQNIQAEGRGEADPVVDCQQQSRPALIACLASNRRVRVEITVDK
ncbi:OmpA family protein [Stenotrophomonas panacihumi]|uniref:OmpA family protein n=1 Tax=Stenotrophomonas panacihumi TaxID=676599 RepID=UPI0009D6DD13|nr:OmpA family protein [Stenotrophomonas panacihumi]PTN55479.1 outer membrane protein assembly factor BamE [Stenotrophomonas panacihumi]